MSYITFFLSVSPLDCTQDDFFSRFARGSHGFVSQLTDESFVTGVLAFLVSNYAVAVWLAVDLLLVMTARNLAGLAR